jgi:hypothetical protein
MMSIDEYAITVGIAGSYPGPWLNTAINTRTSNHALGSSVRTRTLLVQLA